MKFSLIFLLTIFYLTAFCQTTEKEYSYLVNDYPENPDSILEGYQLKDLGNYKFDNDISMTREIIFKGFYDTQDKLVAILLKYQQMLPGQSTSRYKYICIPHPSSSDTMWQYTEQQLMLPNDEKLLKAFIVASSKFISDLTFK